MTIYTGDEIVDVFITVGLFWLTIFGLFILYKIYDWIRDYCTWHEEQDSQEEDQPSSFLTLSLPRTGYKQIRLETRKHPSKTFNKNKYKRYCGLEIECMNPSSSRGYFTEKEAEDYKFSQYTDGSLRGNGVEFSCVPMNGDLLFEKVDSFCEQLQKRGYYVDDRCGMHIHLEIKPEIESLKKIFIFYKNHEKLFFNMMPSSRRNNRYCEEFPNIYSNINQKNLSQCKTTKDFLELLYECEDPRPSDYDDDKRYSWVNFHSVFTQGTLEFRGHSGTVNEDKIKNWLSIQLKILGMLENKTFDQVANMKISKEEFLKLFNQPLQTYIQARWDKFEGTRNAEARLSMEEFKAQRNSKRRGG